MSWNHPKRRIGIIIRRLRQKWVINDLILSISIYLINKMQAQ